MSTEPVKERISISQHDLDDAGPRPWVTRTPYREGFELAFVARRPDERTRFIASPLVFTNALDDGRRSDVPPTVTLPYTQAQALMDGLWECGLRPTEGTGSAGAMGAVQAHLKDLQRLVFDGKKP